jgi:hypothetical protein
MRKIMAGLVLLLVSMQVAPVRGQSAKYPPLSEYMMTPEAEVALARSAAPANISDRATIKVLTTSGYQVAREGDNGFVCMVMRGWSAPTYTPAPFRDLVYDAKVRAPICFNPEASRTVMPYYGLRTKLGMEGKTPDQIAEGLQAAYAARDAANVLRCRDWHARLAAHAERRCKRSLGADWLADL